MLKYSILVPAYNAEAFIMDNLNSVKNQTYTNWELVIVNDGSTDNTLQLINSFVEQNLNLDIKVISISNGGLANARNVALSSATGDYFCNLDADDFLEQDTLKKVSEAFEEEFCDIYYYDIIDFDDTTGVKENFSDKFEKHLASMFGFEAAILKLKRRIWICQGVAFYNLVFIKNSGLKNLPGVNQGEDMYFITSALIHANKVKYIPYPGADIRYRSDSMMHSRFNESYLQCLIAIDKLLLVTQNANIPISKKELLLDLVRRERIIQELRICKSICDSWNSTQTFKQTLKVLKKYSWIKSEAPRNIRVLMSKNHILQYYLNKYTPALYLLLTKIYRII